jgi:hypothetical protein
MSNPDYRALCAELEDAYTWCIEEYMTAPAEEDTLIQRARAALAQPDPISEFVSQCRPLEPEMAEYLTPQARLTPQERWRLYGDEAQPKPVGPTDEEIEAWADAAKEVPLEIDLDVHGWRRCFTAKEFGETIRAALARWGTPANTINQED